MSDQFGSFFPIWQWPPILVALFVLGIDFGAVMAIRIFVEKKFYLTRWWSFKIGDTIGLPVCAGFDDWSHCYHNLRAEQRKSRICHLERGYKPQSDVSHIHFWDNVLPLFHSDVCARRRTPTSSSNNHGVLRPWGMVNNLRNRPDSFGRQDAWKVSKLGLLTCCGKCLAYHLGLTLSILTLVP